MDGNSFELGDEPLDVERRPGGSGVVLSLHFTPEEAEAIFGRAGFEDLGVISYAKRCVLEHAQQYSWTRTLPTPWNAQQRTA